MGLVRRGVIACASGAILAFACMSPTEITLQITTDVSCADLQGVSITVGHASDFETTLPFTATPQCSPDGTIGTFVVLPKSIDEEVAIRVVGGFKSPVDACAPPWGNSCIVSRRILRTVPHTPLYLPIRLTGSCAGVSCDPQSTCVNGACVTATIPDPTTCETPSGCAPDGGPVVVDFGPECGDMSGSQAGSPWPMTAACPRHLARTPYLGPTHTPSVAWTSPSPNGGTLLSVPVVSNDGTVFFGLDDGHGLALDLATGTQRWEVTLGPSVYGNAGIGSDGAFVISGSAGLYGVDGTTHAVRWTLNRGSDVTIGPGNVAYAGMGSDLVAVDVASGTQLWSTPVAISGVTFAAPAIGPDGTLYVSASDGTFVAVDPTSHAIKWQKTLNGIGVPLVTPDGNVFVPNNNAAAFLWAYDAAGNALWNSSLVTSPCISLARDGSLIVPASGGLEWRDPVSGAPRTSYSSSSPIQSCPIVDGSNVVFAVTVTSDVVAVSATNPPVELWKVNVPTAFDLSMANDGTLLVIGTNGTLTALR